MTSRRRPLDPVRETIDSFARDRHFSRRSGAWYRRSDETIRVLEGQRSQYGPSYYLNIAFWLLALGEHSAPSEADCHVRIRFGGLPSVQRAGLPVDELLDLDTDLPDADRRAALAAALERHVEPVLALGGSLDGLASLAADGVLRAAAVRREARSLLADDAA